MDDIKRIELFREFKKISDESVNIIKNLSSIVQNPDLNITDEDLLKFRNDARLHVKWYASKFADLCDNIETFYRSKKIS